MTVAARLPPLCLSLLFASTVHAQASRPPAGVTVDETRTTTLAARPPQPCLSVALEGATVYLDKAELDRLAASKPASSTTEAERQALIAAGRARDLLERLSLERDALGCFATAGRLGEEAMYVVLAALESGTAAVKDLGTGDLAAAVRLRYLGDRCGPKCGRGAITVLLPNGSVPILTLSWWVS